MLRLLFDAHTVQNLSLKDCSVVGIGAGTGVDAAGLGSDVPSRF